MRTLHSLLLMACFLIFAPAAMSGIPPSQPLPPIQPKNNQSQLSEEEKNDIKQLKQVTKFTTNEIDILRRDQINYKIEKDLLKEAYSSNLQSINIIITVFISMFGLMVGLFGYIGFKSIKEVKDDYTKELEDLIKIKVSFEAELLSLTNKQKIVESQVGNITKTNEEQDRRIKVMELIEKISNLIQSKQWLWALKWISAALDIDPKNTILLSQKIMCHGNLGEIASAINVSKLVLEIEPENSNVAFNLLELLALGNQADDFNKIYAKYKSFADAEHDGFLVAYLKALRDLANGDLAKASAELIQLTDKIPNEAQRQYLGSTWKFNEVLLTISKLPEGKQKQLMQKTVQFFQGQINAGDFKKSLQETN